jgi:hypothetical protein
MIRNAVLIGLLTWCAGTLAGCATTEKHASLQLKPVSTGAARSPIVYLTISSDNRDESDGTRMSLNAQKSYLFKTAPSKTFPAAQKITLVNVNNSAGKKVGMRVMPVYAGDLIINRLTKGLAAAGYTVISVPKLPEKTARGIDISWISTEMEQNSGLLTLAGKCELRVRLDMWLNGIKSVSHDYAAITSDYSISDQHPLLAKLMNKAVQEITAQSVPTLITDISATAK